MLKEFDGKVFNGKELQAASAIFALFVSKGEHCLPDAKDALDTYIGKRFPVGNVLSVKKEPVRLKCPSCGSILWATGIKRDGITYDACRSCRYSRMVK